MRRTREVDRLLLLLVLLLLTLLPFIITRDGVVDRMGVIPATRNGVPRRTAIPPALRESGLLVRMTNPVGVRRGVDRPRLSAREAALSTKGSLLLLLRKLLLLVLLPLLLLLILLFRLLWPATRLAPRRCDTLRELPTLALTLRLFGLFHSWWLLSTLFILPSRLLLLLLTLLEIREWLDWLTSLLVFLIVVWCVCEYDGACIVYEEVVSCEEVDVCDILFLLLLLLLVVGPSNLLWKPYRGDDDDDDVARICDEDEDDEDGSTAPRAGEMTRSREDGEADGLRTRPLLLPLLWRLLLYSGVRARVMWFCTLLTRLPRERMELDLLLLLSLPLDVVLWFASSSSPRLVLLLLWCEVRVSSIDSYRLVFRRLSDLPSILRDRSLCKVDFKCIISYCNRAMHLWSSCA